MLPAGVSPPDPPDVLPGRRTVLSASALGVTTFALPSAGAAASPGGDGGDLPAPAAIDPADAGVTPVLITAGGVQYDLYTFPYTGASTATTYTFTPTAGGEAEVLIVAGGGSGGKDRGGGGGAGGVIGTIDLLAADGPTALGRTVTLTASPYTVTVGRGGATQTGLAAGNDGTASSLIGDDVALTATGGGGGGNNGNDGRPGGSGGGGANAGSRSPGSGVSGEGFAGGATGSGQFYGAGGGGAASIGGNASGTSTSSPRGGDGGQGVDIRPFLGDLDVDGSTTAPVHVAGGGGGYGWGLSSGGVGGAGGSAVGGRGGVNDGLVPTAGRNGTGSGGGGGGRDNGAAGGHGVVHLRVRRS